MALSLGEKIRTLFSSTFHDMIDKALKRDPIRTLNQYLRDHEVSLEEAESYLIVAKGNAKSAKRKVEDAQHQMTQIETAIEAIITDSDPQNDYLADNLTVDLLGIEPISKPLD